VAGSELRGLTVGADLRLPTGSAENFLGAGGAAVRALAIGSWEEGRFGLHVNTGVTGGGVSPLLDWTSAATFAAAPRVTLSGELLLRRLSKLRTLEPVYQPHSTLRGSEALRWVAGDGAATALVATGARWSLGASWLLNTSLLFRLTEAGLGARVTPAVSLDYDFAL
jgi:hypothetical protein